MQGVFAHRHPNPPTLLRLQHNTVGSRFPVLVPPFAPGMGVDARGAPLLPDDAIRIAAMPDTRAPGTQRTWLPHELLVDGTDLLDPTGSFRLPLLEVFWLPIYISTARTFDPQPEQPRAATCGWAYRARAGGMERARNRRPDARAGHRRVRARPWHPSPCVRQVAARTQTDVPRHRQPGPRSDPLPPRPPRRIRILAAPHPLHRDAPHTRADVATRRRWQSVRLRAAARRARHARVKLPAAQQLIEENDPSATSHVPTAAWRARRTRRYQRGHDHSPDRASSRQQPGCVASTRRNQGSGQTAGLPPDQRRRRDCRLSSPAAQRRTLRPVVRARRHS